MNTYRNRPLHRKKTARHDSELEFLPEYLAILERSPSRTARLFIAAIMLITTSALAWATWGKVDIIASASGRLMVQDGSKTIQAPELGEVIRITVQDGQPVQQGEVLIELNPTSAQAEQQRLRELLRTADLEVARVSALLTETPFIAPDGLSQERINEAREHLAGEQLSYQAQLQTLRSQIEQNLYRQQVFQQIITDSQALINNAEQRLAGRQALLEKNYYPKLEYLELQKELIELKRDISETRASIAQLESEQQNLQQQLNQIRLERRKALLDRLSDGRNQQRDLRQQLVQASENARRLRILAPVSGVVQQLSVHTLGAVVQPAQALLVIVPDNASLDAEVMILNKDIGFVQVGQQVELKIESFPFTRYGTVKGQLRTISQDAAELDNVGLVYPARIDLSTTQIHRDEQNIPLAAGMRITAEIKTGDRRIIDYLLSPLQEYQSEALRER